MLCILLELLCCAEYLYVTLSACPSHVSLDVSNDTQVLVPVCEPILTSGMTVIKLKLQDPQIAQVKTFFSFFFLAFFGALYVPWAVIFHHMERLCATQDDQSKF